MSSRPETPHEAEVCDTTPFIGAYPTTETVANHSVSKLHDSGCIKAIHTGPGAFKASADEAGGLEPIVSIAHRACVMLTAKLRGW